MKGWVGLVGWSVADGLPTLWSPVGCRLPFWWNKDEYIFYNFFIDGRQIGLADSKLPAVGRLAYQRVYNVKVRHNVFTVMYNAGCRWVSVIVKTLKNSLAIVACLRADSCTVLGHSKCHIRSILSVSATVAATRQNLLIQTGRCLHA